MKYQVRHMRRMISVLLFLFLVPWAGAQEEEHKRVGFFIFTVHNDFEPALRAYMQVQPLFLESECSEMQENEGFQPQIFKYGPKAGYKEVGYECRNTYEDTFLPFARASLDASDEAGRAIELRFSSMGDEGGAAACVIHYCGWPKNTHPPGGYCGACPH